MFQAGNLGFVGHEEVVQVPRYEPEGGFLLDDDVDDVLAVVVSGVSEERLGSLVVVIGQVLELGCVVAVWIERDRLGERPASERARGVLDVVLGVVVHAHAEQLEQLAPPVLVGLVGVILAVVEPVVHGRVAGQGDEYGAQVGHSNLAEHIDLGDDGRAVLALVPRGRENMVPEQRHLLFERPFRVYHPPNPASGPHVEGVVVRQISVVSLQHVLFEVIKPFGMDQPLDYLLVRHFGQIF